MNIEKDYKDILGHIKTKGCLDFTLESKLRQLSKQIPDNICGVYMFVEKKEDEDNILYIGCSGHIEDGKPVSRKKHGLRGRIYGKQEKTPRDQFYKEVMKDKDIAGLKVYWFDTGNDDPEYIEYRCILKYITIKGKFPEFNNKLERKENKSIQKAESETQSK
jgi:hypothetical protein